jgi:hypothetical protein
MRLNRTFRLSGSWLYVAGILFVLNSGCTHVRLSQKVLLLDAAENLALTALAVEGFAAFKPYRVDAFRHKGAWLFHYRWEPNVPGNGMFVDVTDAGSVRMFPDF